MRKYLFASSPLAWRIILRALIILAIMVIIFFDKTAPLISCVLFWTLGSAIYIMRYRNVFCPFFMDEAGLHSKHVTIAWEEIKEYHLCNIVWYYGVRKNFWNRHVLPSVVCIGAFQADKEFIKQDRRHCIFFSLTEKHLNALEQYGKGKSPVVDRILEYKEAHK